MNITTEQLYWILKLDNIRDLFLGGIIVAIVAIVLGSIIFLGFVFDGIPYNETTKRQKYFKRYCVTIVFVILFILINTLATVFTPSTKQMATILVLPKIVNSDFVQEELPKETRELYNLTKDYIKNELKGK